MQKTIINIGLDIDDTINKSAKKEFKEHAILFCKEKGIEFKENTEEFYVKPRFGFSDAHAQEFIQRFVEKIDMQSAFYKDCINVMHKMKQHDLFDIRFIMITARSSANYSDVHAKTANYLSNGNVPFDKLVVDVEDKLKVCLEHDIHIFADDSYKHCENVASAGHIKTFIRNQPYNQHFEHSGVTRIESLQSIYEHICKAA